MTRSVIAINRNWLYHDAAVGGFPAPDFDDSAWERVTIPHTVRRLPWHSFDDQDYQFVSAYRRRFTPPATIRGQRVFVDFGAVMTAATVWINGVRLGEYRGGYTPFSFELTQHLRWDGDNVLAVEVDSRERADIPPFGGQIDYLTFGGIYRDVTLRAVADTYIDNLFAKSVDALQDTRRVDVRCFFNNDAQPNDALQLEVELRDGDQTLATVREVVSVGAGDAFHDVALADLPAITLWDLDQPQLYTVVARLWRADTLIDEYQTRIGFREARFTPDGFYLNGERLKLRGLNRHQTYPYVGQAMPARVQRQDALILKHELHCNIVRTSHYPQSPYFLDCCDEIGLLVFEEIPGWQHVGDVAWQDIAVRTNDMIKTTPAGLSQRALF